MQAIRPTIFILIVLQVVTGLLQAEESVIVNSDNCAQLLAHEATRVFHDRLVDEADRQAFYAMLADNLHDYFKVPTPATATVKQPVLTLSSPLTQPDTFFAYSCLYSRY